MARHRRPNGGGFRVHRNYTVEEAARVTGYAKGTLRRQIKAGLLPAIIDRRPHLILGGDLLDYMKMRTKSGPRLQLHECYCLKCRKPRSPAFSVAEYFPLTASTGNLRALCEVCTTVMHKAISVAALTALQAKIEVTIQQAGKHLMDNAAASHNDHLEKEPESHA